MPPDDGRTPSETIAVEIVESLADLNADDWNALSGGGYPFLRHEFLSAAETTGCVSPEAGWSPVHLVLRKPDGGIRAAMPLYQKTHSWGEFVFDWAWASAYERAGLSYYPKLVSAAPFTPAPSPRLLLADPQDEPAALALAHGAVHLAGELGYSSLHVQFPLEHETPTLEAAGLQLRKDCQFHWHNRGYSSFDDFLATFSSKKRKKARRDRRSVAEQGITFRWLTGHDLDAAIWRDVYELISTTFLRRGSMPYYNLDFFLEVTARMPDSMLVVLAEKGGEPIAAAVFYCSDTAIYGRYWGSDGHYDALHFETCYHQGIEYCIREGKQLFEPGTQGEHKISRGFVPVHTWSAHWLARPEFFAAVSEYLESEGRHIDNYVDHLRSRTPYRQSAADTPDNNEA